MSFGITQAMIISLRNNCRRQKSRHFDKDEAYIGYGYKNSKAQFKKATKKQLLAIRSKLKKEQQLLFKKRLLGFIGITTTALLFFYLIVLSIH